MTTDTRSAAAQSLHFGAQFGAPGQTIRALGELGTAEIIQLGDTTAVRATFQPGFRWTEHVKPIAGTDLCQVRHVGYVVSGRARIRLADGVEGDVKAGDVFDMPPGHDMWTVGDEPYVAVDFTAGPQLTNSHQTTSMVPPDHHAVLFENDQVRVLEVRIPAGGTSGRHSHPRSVVYQMSEAHVRMSAPDGSSRELDLAPGQITWTDGTTHTVDNIGRTEDVGLFVELKS